MYRGSSSDSRVLDVDAVRTCTNDVVMGAMGSLKALEKSDNSVSRMNAHVLASVGTSTPYASTTADCGLVGSRL